MILRINTIKNNSTEIEAALLDAVGKVIVKKIIKARYQQAEKLLPLIDSVLNSYKRKITEIAKKKKNYELRIKNYGFITMIEVVNRGGTFTSLRIGVATANALGYALNVPVVGISEDGMINVLTGSKNSKFPHFAKAPRGKQILNSKFDFDIVAPEYDKEPNITIRNT
ncbi:MAG: hypothetical protein WCW25_02695 [Patescibacteria group bacterium]|jgi:tRNA A37 threonylcarbamoyladenosine modification protein TsaB